MASINITIIESPLQKVEGIPSTITFETNIPATVFYTFDGTDPTTSSQIAIGPVDVPPENTVTLKVFATNGIMTSPIITNVYGTTFVGQRRPRDTVTGLQKKPKQATFPYGSLTIAPGFNGIYGNAGGIVVDNCLEPQISDGYDGRGNPAGFTNQPFTLQFYDIIYSETDSIGQMGNGIGTLPATVKVIEQQNDNDFPETSDANSPFFDARALVIYQDNTEEPYDKDIATVMRPRFSLERPGVVRDGVLLQTTETLTTTGSLLRTNYNPKDNTITYAYFDSTVNRWIFSKVPYESKSNTPTNLSSIVFSSSSPGAKYVYPWNLFYYRRLI
ncbi:MAG: hypothetical protein HC877_22360 [Thioploca sp.]|nr:hypothetical protein [Thioploca sp.]